MEELIIKKNEYATTNVKEALQRMVHDKIDNMTGSEITDKLAKFVSENEEEIANMAFSLIENDEIVNTGCNLKAASHFDIESLTKECDEEDPDALLYDALYNYDALWMTAIQKCFPDNTTDNQCGCGAIKYVDAPVETFSSMEEAMKWGDKNLGQRSFSKVKINNVDKSEVVFLSGTDRAYEEELWGDIYEVLKDHIKRFDTDIDDDDDEEIVDQTSEIRDIVIEWIEKSTGCRFVNIANEY